MEYKHTKSTMSTDSTATSSSRFRYIYDAAVKAACLWVIIMTTSPAAFSVVAEELCDVCPCFQYHDLLDINSTVVECGSSLSCCPELGGIVFESGRQVCSGDGCLVLPDADNYTGASCFFSDPFFGMPINAEYNHCCQSLITAYCAATGTMRRQRRDLLQTPSGLRRRGLKEDEV
jgi:hypothetical protein